MIYSKLGHTNIEVSKICLGTMTFGEQNTEKEAHQQLDYARERGINFIDTAELYSVPGRQETQGSTERYIGSWLKSRTDRDKIVLATKIAGPNPGLSYIRNPLNFSKEQLNIALEGSLKRLQTDYVDIYQLHWPERKVNSFGKLGYEYDAEGRLVLADGLWYAREKFKPRAMVDIATLTGSKVGALGSYYAGLFSEHEALVQQLTLAGQQVDEEVWRLPLNSKLKGEMKSDLADLSNTGKTTGASTAAWFLQQFTGDTPWAHLDIAGNALANSDKGVQVTGGTGFGVRLLTEWALSQP